MRAAIASAPGVRRGGVAGGADHQDRRRCPRTCTSPSLSPLAGLGMPTHDAVANDAAPRRQLRLERRRRRRARSRVVGVPFAGRSTQLITELASTSAS